ncbi:MAG: FapA family protein [Deltaproteobacteria bacterium]|nr:FapA family protein [Deltaproteobacteria bacterium]
MAKDTDQSSVDISIKLIAEYVTEAYHLRFEAHNNRLECRASITVHNTDESIPPAELIKLLRKNNITDTVDLEQVAIFCSEAATGEDPENVLIARGVEPINGVDGWFELIVSTGDEDKEFSADEHGRVNFKSVQTFSNVTEGQQIGTIHPPTGGIPGKTISGEPIPSIPGNPSLLRVGHGVKTDSEGMQVIATEPGRAFIDNNCLSIVEEFVVDGNVDLKVGHITFNGFVIVKGDVLDDFNITASKGINIAGAIGACKIKSGGPVTIGTMAGMGTGSIHCSGSLTARYLNQVYVECLENITITSEVRNSTIKATGYIDIAKGTITGGQAVALEGIETKIAGARVGVKTHLAAGIYFPESDRLHFLRTQLKSSASQIKTIGETLDGLKKKPLEKMRSALREAFELRIDVLSKRSEKLEQVREECSEELLNFKTTDHPTANPKINILSVLKEGVIISLGEAREEIQRDITGPVSIIENTHQGGLRQFTYSPLKITASEVETEALKEEQESTS